MRGSVGCSWPPCLLHGSHPLRADIPLRFLHTTQPTHQSATHLQHHASTPISSSSSFFASLSPSALLAAGDTALQHNQLDTVLQIFRSLQQHSSASPSISAYNLLIGCSAHVGDSVSAVQLVQKVCQPHSEGGKGLSADADTLLHLFTALVRDDKCSEVVQLLSELDTASKSVSFSTENESTAVHTTLLGTILIKSSTLRLAPSLELLLRITNMMANRGHYKYGHQVLTMIQNRYKADKLHLHAHAVAETATTMMRLAVGSKPAATESNESDVPGGQVLACWQSTRSLLAQLMQPSSSYHISTNDLLALYSSAVRSLCRTGNLAEGYEAYKECYRYVQLLTSTSSDAKQRQKLTALMKQPTSTHKNQGANQPLDTNTMWQNLLQQNPEVPASTTTVASSSSTFLRRLVQNQIVKQIPAQSSSEATPVILPAGAQRAFNQMLRSLIKCCSLVGDSQLAERVFSDCHKLNITPTAAVYEQLLLSHAPWRQAMYRRRMADVKRGIVESSEGAAAPLVSQQQLTHSWFIYHHRARTLYREMLQAGIQPTPAVLQTLTSAISTNFTFTTPATSAAALSSSNHLQLRYGIMDSVKRLLRQTTSRGYTPDQMMLQCLVESYIAVSAPWHALHMCTVFIYQYHVQLNSDILTLLAAAAMKLPAGETRVKYYLKYRDLIRESKIDSEDRSDTHLHWLRALTGSDGTNDWIQRILGQAMDSKVATIEHFHVIARVALVAPVQWSSWRFVIRLFYGVVSANPHTVLTTGPRSHAKALTPTMATYEMLLRTAASLSNAGDAMNLYSHMQRQSNIAPTASTIASVLHAIVTAHPPLPEHTRKAQLKNLLKDMQQHQFTVDEVIGSVHENDVKKLAIRETLLQATKDTDINLDTTARTKRATASAQQQHTEHDLTDSDLILT